MSSERERALVWAAAGLFVGGAVVLGFDLMVTGPSHFSLAGLASILGCVGLLVFLEAAYEPRVGLGDCICPRHIRYGEIGLDPKGHRPSCPVRRQWEKDRREDDCGCGPPPIPLDGP